MEELGCWETIEERARQEKVRTDRGTCLEIQRWQWMVSGASSRGIENNNGLGCTKPGVIYFRKERCLPNRSESVLDRSLIIVRSEERLEMRSLIFKGLIDQLPSLWVRIVQVLLVVPNLVHDRTLLLAGLRLALVIWSISSRVCSVMSSKHCWLVAKMSDI